jgi:hypothetical protein
MSQNIGIVGRSQDVSSRLPALMKVSSGITATSLVVALRQWLERARP